MMSKLPYLESATSVHREFGASDGLVVDLGQRLVRKTGTRVLLVRRVNLRGEGARRGGRLHTASGTGNRNDARNCFLNVSTQHWPRCK